MKLPFLNIEVFFAPAAPHQWGYWVDREPKRWVSFGVRRTVLTVAKLPGRLAVR